MSLVSYVNRSCPVGVSHFHGPSTTPKLRTVCLLCGDEKKRGQFCWHCKDYNNKKVIELNKEQLFILHLIFSSEDFYIPNELRDIIFKKSVIIRIESIPIKLDEQGIDHMYNCRKCSRKFLEFLDKHSCSRHIIPRISVIINYQYNNDY